MAEILNVGILDYTPTEYDRYREHLAIEVIHSALKESASDNVFISAEYVRGLKEEIPDSNFDMFIISGSPLSPLGYSGDLKKALEQITEVIYDVPVFGICFGLHAIAKLTGNGSMMIKEFEMGPKEVMLYEDIEGVGRRGNVLLFPVNHFYKITNSNHAMKVLGVSNEGIQIADATEFFDGNPVMAVQFHPEFAASDKGWHAFKRIFRKTIDIVISGEYPEATMAPVVRALDKKVKKRFLQTVYDPENLIGKGLSKEQRTLLMSLFHNTEFKKKLLGKAESYRTYRKLQANSQSILGHFLEIVLKRKAELEEKKRPDVELGVQLELGGSDKNYLTEMKKIAGKGGMRRPREKRPHRERPKQLKLLG
jgi:GMP synthase-like glutamine amidotransferase